MAVRRWISTSSTSFSTAANWSGTTVPISNDTIIFDGTGTAALSSNLDQSALTGITLIITQDHTAAIGSDALGTATYFQIGASTASIGRSEGSSSRGAGSPLVLLDFGSTTNATNVLNTSTSSTNAKYPPVCIKGSGVTLTQSGGTVGVATRPSETAAGLTVKLTRGLTGSTPSVYLGSGVTLTLVTIDAGNVYSLSDNTCTAARVAGGNYYVNGSAPHTLLNVDSGTTYYLGTGTVTEGHVRGVLDMSSDARARTVTDLSLYRGGTLNIDNGVPGSVTFTNPINYPDGCSSDVVTIATPAGVKGSLAAI